MEISPLDKGCNLNVIWLMPGSISPAKIYTPFYLRFEHTNSRMWVLWHNRKASILFHWLLWYTKCLHYLSDYTVLTHLNTNEYTIFQDLADHDLTLCIHCANISNTIYTIDNSKKFFIATTPFTDDESILYLVLSWLLSLNINKLSLILCFYCANTSNQILYTMFKN